MQFDEWFARQVADGRMQDDCCQIAYEAWHAAHRYLPDAVIYEREMLRARFERALKILSAIHALLPPPDMEMADGRVMRFHKPELESKLLRELSIRIRNIPDEVKAAEEAKPEDRVW